MRLNFSKRPGCWERQLQRKYDNPLFLGRDITQNQVDEAKRKDQNESVLFQHNFYKLVSEVADLKAQVDVEIILSLKSRIDQLYEECASLGGDFSEEKEGLRKLNELIMQAIWASGGMKDTKAREAFEKEIEIRALHFTLLEYPLVAHIVRSKSPIAEDEMAATLLTEEEIPLLAAMAFFNREQQEKLCQQASLLLNQLKDKGYELPEVWKKLEAMNTFLSSE